MDLKSYSNYPLEETMLVRDILAQYCLRSTDRGIMNMMYKENDFDRVAYDLNIDESVFADVKYAKEFLHRKCTVKCLGIEMFAFKVEVNIPDMGSFYLRWVPDNY